MNVKTRENTILYICDSSKNKHCPKKNCKDRDGGECDATSTKAYQKSGTKPFRVKKAQNGDEVIFVREYIEE